MVVVRVQEYYSETVDNLCAFMLSPIRNHNVFRSIIIGRTLAGGA
jgi:hypothetical protein